MYNWAATRGRADYLINKYGFTAFLRRGTDDRPCQVVEGSYSPRQVDGVVIQRTDRRFYISVTGLGQPPDEAEDVLIIPPEDGVGDETTLIIPHPPARLAPGNVNILWDVQARSR